MTGSGKQAAGSVAVVTGAGRGIGRAIAERLAGDGFTVVGCGRSDRPADLLGSIRWQTADVADSADVAKLLRFATGLGGPVGVVVNNAGIQVEREVVDTTDDDWERLVGTNCRGVFHMCRAFIPKMLETGGGVIINVGSISAMAADRSMAVYNASKGIRACADKVGCIGSRSRNQVQRGLPRLDNDGDGRERVCDGSKPGGGQDRCRGKAPRRTSRETGGHRRGGVVVDLEPCIVRNRAMHHRGWRSPVRVPDPADLMLVESGVPIAATSW